MINNIDAIDLVSMVLFLLDILDSLVDKNGGVWALLSNTSVNLVN